MHRYFVRFLVAALTFVVGVVISAVPIFHSTTNYELVRHDKRRPCPKRTALFPAVTINNLPTEPLRLSYLSSNLDPSDSNRVIVQVLVENQSGQDISDFAVDYHTDGTGSSNFGGRESFAMPLQQGATRIVTIKTDSNREIQVWPAYTQFIDGTYWVNQAKF
jgi:hypothetical protein